MFADRAYAGQWAATVQTDHGFTVEVIRHPAKRQVGHWIAAGQQDLFAARPPPAGFMVLPNAGWSSARTPGMSAPARCLIMHHDRLNTVSEAWVWPAEARLLARRLIA